MCVYVFIKCGNYSLMLIFFFPMHEFLKDILGRQKTHKKLKTSRSTRDFFFVLGIFCASSLIFFLCSIQREKENTQRKTHAWVSVETRKKHLQEEQHAIARVYSFKTTARQEDGGVWSSFFSGRQN